MGVILYIHYNKNNEAKDNKVPAFKWLCHEKAKIKNDEPYLSTLFS